MKTKILAIAMIAVLVLGMGVSYFRTSTTGEVSLPKYAKTMPKIEEAYRFAVDNPEALNGVNCYCGCMHHLHDGRIHKRGLLDCYMKEDGSFDRHASNCDMCINDALDVKKWTEEGVSKEEIKMRIDNRYKFLR